MSQATPDFTKYPAAQRAAYLGAIASLLTADHEASPAEGEFLSHLAQATGLSQQDAQHVVDAALDPNNGSLNADLTTLKSSDLRFSLVQDLISFAQSDGQYSDAEQERIGQMAQFLGVSEEQFDALHQFQQAAADGQNVNDPRFLQQSGIGSLFSQLGLPKGGGMLSGILAAAGPMILQKVLAGRGAPGGMGAGAPGAGGGLMGILGQVMGGMGGAPQPGQAASGGGLMGILGQVMGGMGGAPQQSAGMGSGMGGLGQILQVLGQMGGPGAGAPPPQAATAQGRGGYDAVGGLIGELFPKQ
jgi:uncharacterized tellurite resistance protein B-like protein